MTNRVLDIERDELFKLMGPHASSDFELLDRVAYIPMHANYDITHVDVEWGTVSSRNDKFVFVKFDRQVNMLGWKGTTSQSCGPADLIILR